LGLPLLDNEEFEVVIMIAVATEEMLGRTESWPENDYEPAYGWERQHHL
jgi:hypothetical protein